MKKLSINLILLLLPGIVTSQDGIDLFEEHKWGIVLTLLIIVGVVAVLALLTVWSGLKAIVREQRIEKGMESSSVLIDARDGEEHLGFWDRFWNRFNSSVPVAVEDSVATSHEYDGIRELDNRLPPWWLYGFYLSIFFGVIYLLNYEILGTGMTQNEEFQAEMTEANKQVEAYLATLGEEEGEIVFELLTDASALAAGSKIYDVNCAQCHAKDGGGMNALGPNLTDRFWKNGGDFDAIVAVVKGGVNGTSMIPWESQLRPAQIQEVASFVYSLEGTTPTNPKDPEGELFERKPELQLSPSDTIIVD